LNVNIGFRAQDHEMAIRTATLKDESAVIALWVSCGLVASYNEPSHDFEFALTGACSDVLVNEDEAGQINASVMVGHDGHRGWFYYVATSPQARATGLGRKLVEAGEQWLRERGLLKVQLLVRETNADIVSFYQHLGFELTPRIVIGKWLK
jgi:ribosomal protein S18 acetylase RimI-like enzyme